MSDESMKPCGEIAIPGGVCNLPSLSEVLILYTNWKGKTEWRRILPSGIRFATTQYHPESQWLLDAHDLDKDAERTFAVKDILQWGDDHPRQDWFADVLEFHKKLALSIIRPLPTVPDHRGQGQYCIGFMEEELKEIKKAMAFGMVNEVADGLTDLIVVTIRAALIWGIDLRPVWNEVHRSNMLKEGGETRADSKVMKPEGWLPPDVEGILAKQRPIV